MLFSRKEHQMCRKKVFEDGGVLRLLLVAVFVALTAFSLASSVAGQSGCIAACDKNQCYEVKNSPGNFGKMDLPCYWIWVYQNPANPDYQLTGTGPANQYGNCSGSRMNCAPTVTNSAEATSCGLGSNWTIDNFCGAACVAPTSG
jgi:hypothetical protein